MHNKPFHLISWIPPLYNHIYHQSISLNGTNSLNKYFKKLQKFPKPVDVESKTFLEAPKDFFLLLDIHY